MSKLCDLAPASPWLNTLVLESMDTAIVGPVVNTLLIEPSRLKPSEAYHFWEYYCPGFSVPCRDLGRDDVTYKKRNASDEY